MKFLLVALNAKYIHSNPGVYSLKTYVECGLQGDRHLSKCDLPCVHVEIAEYTINNQMEQVLEDIYRRKPDVVGFSCYIWNIVPALDLIHDLHKVLPNTHIWVGGPEVSFDAPALLEREPEILGVMKGEGEETFAGVVNAYENPEQFWELLEQVDGITLRNLDRPIRPVMDMSKIPFIYPNLDGFEHRIVYYESSRGCPFSCSYCLSSIDKSVRFRDIKLVKEELSYFIDRNIPQVKFVDRTFNCKKKHAMEIWSHILEHDNGITNFHFEIAADLLDEEQIQLLSKMRPGLVQLEIGVQSTNLHTIQEIRRKMDLAEVKRTVGRINSFHNIHQHLDLIVGLPFEDYESFQKSFNDVFHMEPEQLQLGFLKVLKGSYMYEMREEYGLVYRQLPPYEVLSSKWITYEEVLILKGVENMVEVYYNSGQFTKTLELLIPQFKTPYAFFESLSVFFAKQGMVGMSHSRIAKYELLHEFIKQVVLGEGKPTLEQYEDALMIDLYLRENSKSRPSFAPDPFKHKEMIRKSVPSLRILGSQIHPEVMQTGELVVFDYRKRDPLTRNALIWEEKDYEESTTSRENIRGTR